MPILTAAKAMRKTAAWARQLSDRVALVVRSSRVSLANKILTTTHTQLRLILLTIHNLHTQGICRRGTVHTQCKDSANDNTVRNIHKGRLRRIHSIHTMYVYPEDELWYDVLLSYVSTCTVYGPVHQRDA